MILILALSYSHRLESSEPRSYPSPVGGKYYNQVSGGRDKIGPAWHFFLAIIRTFMVVKGKSCLSACFSIKVLFGCHLKSFMIPPALQESPNITLHSMLEEAKSSSGQ